MIPENIQRNALTLIHAIEHDEVDLIEFDDLDGKPRYFLSIVQVGNQGDYKVMPVAEMFEQDPRDWLKHPDGTESYHDEF